MPHLAIAVGTGTWGIAAVIPKYLSLRLLLLHILLNPVSCGADGLLGDAHDAADVAVFKAHLVEDEEESVVGSLRSIFLLDATERGEVDGLIVVDEAFVVVVRPTRDGAVCLISLT